MFVSCRSGDTSTNAVSANPPQFVSITPNGEIAVLRDEQQVGSLPAEYIPLDYPDMPWRGDPAIGMSSDGTFYVALYAKIFVSKNG